METVKIPLSMRQLSHELRTPLTGILGMAYCLSQEQLTPEQENYVSNIYQAGEQLLSIINIVLSAKKVEK